MAFNVITVDKSRTNQLLDDDGNGFLLVTEGAYITTANNAAYLARGGNGTISIAGAVVSQFDNGMSLEAATNNSAAVGSNDISITSTGLVQGRFSGLAIYGNNNTIENHGIVRATFAGIGYGIFLSGGNNIVENSGSITAATGLYCNVGDIFLTNTGLISSTIHSVLSYGSSDIDNLGTMIGTIQSADTLSLRNSGFIDGSVIASNSNDDIDNSLGIISRGVMLEGGADTYVGGAGSERVAGGSGADTIDLGAGNDVYLAGNADGKDDLDGGDGIDTYSASDATLSVSVDLSAATTALTIGNDIVLNFENIIGGSANDTLIGSDDVNRINGGAGADSISGGDGNDRLLGGDGADTITGGAGRDIMAGGTATGLNSSDRFVFADGDTGATSKTRDAITDFTDHGSASGPYATGADTIDLRSIDASTTAAGNQAFSFNATSGAAFSGSAGSLIWQQQGSFVLIYGDTDGDSKADFVIQLFGVHNLLASDFLL